MKKIYFLVLFISATSASVFGQQVRINAPVQEENLLKIILDSLRNRPSMSGLRIKMKNINFETNSAAIKPTSRVYLDTIALVLNELPSIVFEVSGHTDNVGNPEANRKLSVNRAKSIRDFLVLNGKIKSTRVSFQGYGATRPIANNRTEAGRSLNRRVEMQFVGLDQTQKNEITFLDGTKKEALFIYRDDANKKILYKLNDSSPMMEVKMSEVASISFADGRSVEFQTLKKAEVTQIHQQNTAPATFVTAPRKPRKVFAAMVYAEGLYVIESLSKSWSNRETGVGILQGFGGGIMLNYYLKERVGVTLQGGFSKWQVERRYISTQPEKQLQYTANETITRIPFQVGLKLYPFSSVYFHPFAGGQLTTRLTETSQLHPNGLTSITTKGFIPAVGAAIGFEKYFGVLFIDVAAQYNYILNKDFTQITDPLHFAGLRVGVGYKSKK